MTRILLVLLVPLLLPSGAAAQRAAAKGACFDAVQGEVAWNQKGATRWNPSNVKRLCKGAADSTEPARCFEEVMHGDVARGSGRWGWSRVLDLCQGTHDAAARIDCLEDRVRGGAAAKAAVEACRDAGSERPSQRLEHRVRKPAAADYERLELEQTPAQVQRPEPSQEQAKPEKRPGLTVPLGSEAVRETIAEQAVGQAREHPPCEQVPMTRERMRLDEAKAAGNRLRLEGCMGTPGRDAMRVQIQAGDRITRETASFRGTTAELRAPDLAFEDGAVVSLLRTRNGEEAYQLTPEIPIQRVSGDADGDGSIASEWGGADCDDTDARRFPGNTEVPDDDHVDEDCDPSTFGKVDRDRDGFYSDEYCNRAPNGELICGQDCDDRYMNVNPAHSETPGDGIDNDCDGVIDTD